MNATAALVKKRNPQIKKTQFPPPPLHLYVIDQPRMQSMNNVKKQRIKAQPKGIMKKWAGQEQKVELL